MRKPAIFAVVLTLGATSACVPSTMQATETETALCESWGRSLPTRSRSDTEQTRAEIQIAYADFLGACPGYEYLLPVGEPQ